MDREAQAIQMWTRGDYAIVGDWFAAASLQVLEPLALGEGRRLLDVACGTGTVAIEAARRGAAVVGLDLTPAMLDIAQQRAAAAGVQPEWRQGSFERLEDLGPFDAVTSAFGVMFASDPRLVAVQLASVCAPGGQIVIASWHQDGAFGADIPALRALLGGAPAGPDTTRWSQRDAVAAFFDGTPATLTAQQKHTIQIPFDSVDDVFHQFRAHSGPWQMLLEYLDSLGAAAQAADAIKDHLRQHATPRADGRIDLRVSYAVSVLHREGVRPGGPLKG